MTKIIIQSVLLVSMLLGSIIYTIYQEEKQNELQKIEEIKKEKIAKEEKRIQYYKKMIPKKTPNFTERKLQLKKKEWSENKIVYLTFDDGPNQFTNQILNILNKHQVKGTFFIIGNRVKGNEKIIQRIKNEGHYIGLHSMTHNKKNLYVKPEGYITEFKKEKALLKTIGIDTNLTRAPYGSKPYLTVAYRNKIAQEKMKLWDWTIDTYDWKYKKTPQKVLTEIQKQLKEQHEVVLLHDNEITVKMLPQIIHYFKSKGYLIKEYDPNLHFEENFWDDKRL